MVKGSSQHPAYAKLPISHIKISDLIPADTRILLELLSTKKLTLDQRTALTRVMSAVLGV